MRLACPNCDARYEVPDDAIPAEGRDVQCSNCGNAWFQLKDDPALYAGQEADYRADFYGADMTPPAFDAPRGPSRSGAHDVDNTEDQSEYGAETAAFSGGEGLSKTIRSMVSQQAEEPMSPAIKAAAIAAGQAAAHARAAVPEPEAVIAAARGQAVQAMPVPSSKLDDSLLSILHEEAERETSARRQEAQRLASRQADADSQFQTQPDLGLESMGDAAASRYRFTAPQDEDFEAEPDPLEAVEPTTARAAPRRDLLPDVEEINSTLHPGDAGYNGVHGDDDLPEPASRSGFRAGFIMALALLAVAVVLYVLAGDIGGLVPALAPALEGYVGFVDMLRIGLNHMMDQATESLGGAAPSAP